MLLSTAVEKFIRTTNGTVFSPKSIPTIKSQFKRVLDFFGKRHVGSLTYDDWCDYLNFLRFEYVPKRVNKDTSAISETTIHNHMKMIHSFYKWANEVLGTKRVDRKLPRVKYQSPQTAPFSQKEIEMLIGALDFSQVKKRSSQTYQIRRKFPDRNRAMVLVLLDTGIRAGELARLRVEDVNLVNQEIYIRPYRNGIKSRARTVYMGEKTTQVLKRYIERFRKHSRPTLFGLDGECVRFMIRRLGENAGVVNAHPHRFRHTFAINYLRNGGDQFTLQRLLGHTSPDMTQKYLDIAQYDVANQHRRASPVDNWNI